MSTILRYSGSVIWFCATRSGVMITVLIAGGLRVVQLLQVQAGALVGAVLAPHHAEEADRKSTRLNSSHLVISYAVFCLKTKTRLKRDYLCHTIPLLVRRCLRTRRVC